MNLESARSHLAEAPLDRNDQHRAIEQLGRAMRYLMHNELGSAKLEVRALIRFLKRQSVKSPGSREP